MSELEKFSDFHFIAIGGVGQSALAKILLCLGFRVSGSDIEESKYTKLVSKLGADVYIGHSEENLKGRPKVVVSSAIKKDNPEYKKALDLGLEIMHRSDCLKFISEIFPCFIGFSGTHGKTTTSGLMSYLLEKTSNNPSYAIGGIIPEYNINAIAHKNSKYFVAELDESDGTISKYKPQILVINNLEPDHLDFYKNGLPDILDTFSKTLSNMDKTSPCFINIDNFGCVEFIKKNKDRDFITYGIEKEAKYSAQNIELKDLGSCFDFYREGELRGHIELIIPGVHNIYNALSVLSVLDYLDIDAFEYFKSFSGMGRRFQIVHDVSGIKIVDDYAHHPSELKSTLSSIKNTKRRKIAIFQPHRYTRLKALWGEFLESFFDIDILYVVDVFNAGDKFDPEFNSENFAKEINNRKVRAKYIKGNMKEAAEKIAPDIKEGDLILTLGAGDITQIGGFLYDLLSK